MDVLTRERGAPTVGTAVPVSLESADAATEQDALELLDMAGRGGHDLKDSPPHAWLLPTERRSQSDTVCGVQGAGRDRQAGSELMR